MKIIITWHHRPWRDRKFIAQARLGGEHFIEVSSDVSFQEARHKLASEIMSCMAARKEEKLKTPEPEELTIGELM